MSQQEEFYSYHQLHPPVMKDKSKNAARNRREKENGEWISCLGPARLFSDNRPDIFADTF